MASVYQKRRVWYVSYKDGRGLRRLVRTTAETKTEAKRLALELERGAERQRLGLEELPSECGLTLSELCDWWLKTWCKPRRAENLRLRLKRHVFETPLGKTLVPRVTAAVIEAQLCEMQSNGLSASTQNSIRATLHTVFSRARKSRLWSGPNPVADVEAKRVPRRVRDTLRAEEVPLLLAQVPADWRGVFATALYAGLRKGEIFGLCQGDVDLASRLLLVRRSYDEDTTKGAHADVIPIADPLVPYLRQAIQNSPSEYIFPDEHGRMRRRDRDPRKVLRRALARAGLVEGYEHVCRRCKAAKRVEHSWRHLDDSLRRCPDPKCRMKLWPRPIHRKMRFHDLRHATATLLLRAGVDIHRVQRILRHRNVALTASTYAHLNVEDLRPAVDALPASFVSLPQLPPAREKSEKTAPRATRLLPAPHPDPKTKAAASQNHEGSRGLIDVGPTGFEPATSSVSRKRSYQLSYGPAANGAAR
jgi:integrase